MQVEVLMQQTRARKNKQRDRKKYIFEPIKVSEKKNKRGQPVIERWEEMINSFLQLESED